MRTGGHNFKGGPTVTDKERGILDWVNLPQGTETISLWDCLHDAHVVCIVSNLIERTMVLSCDIEHLRSFHGLAEGFQFSLNLENVHSARVLRYAVWPGEFTVPKGVSREEESLLIAEYQSKWREESLSWDVFETTVTREDEQVFDISDATLAFSSGEEVAFRLCGHLNYAIYHEIFARATGLKISGTDGKQFTIEEFQKLGQSYWEAFVARKV
jgi:hypothetical protein